jgi:uncharacterized protein with PIN domain
VSRIGRAFERRFRELLAEAGARQCDKGLRWLFARAEDRARNTGTTVSHALAEMNIALVEKLHRLRANLALAREAKLASALVGKRDATSKVFCDAGLGGLARWLRASGCDALWVQDISDADLVARAEEINAVIITTDSFLLDRRPIAHGRVRAIWVPPTLTKFEQLRLVRAELDLSVGESRCMRCGGELVQVDKEAVKDRIPPRTYLWLDDYWQCQRCGQLFWHGTHWSRVTERLRKTA